MKVDIFYGEEIHHYFAKIGALINWGQERYFLMWWRGDMRLFWHRLDDDGFWIQEEPGDHYLILCDGSWVWRV